MHPSPLFQPPTEAPTPDAAIQHAFLAFGGRTYLRDGNGKIVWEYPHATRDGWALDDGNVLLALNRSQKYPGGALAEVTRTGKAVFVFPGTQSEVNTVQKLSSRRYLLTEAGPNPRILEVDRSGRLERVVPLLAQTNDHHMQSRMTRKLANGNYLVPQLFDKVVREYTPRGQVVWEVKTPHWPFTAIRLENGNTVIGCTYGNVVIEVDPSGRTVWQLTNDDLPGDRPFNDACGVQRLPSGNTVITAYGARGGAIKLFEVTPQKKLVWAIREPELAGIHHFQILDTNGTSLRGRPLR